VAAHDDGVTCQEQSDRRIWPGVRAHQASRVPALCALAGSVGTVPGTNRGTWPRRVQRAVISRPEDMPPVMSNRKIEEAAAEEQADE
jgi:hypothetical protein